MESFSGMSLIIPALNETYLLEKTVEVVQTTCNREDIVQIILVLCEKTTRECTETAEKLKEEYNNLVMVMYQKMPFIGGAYKDALPFVTGSHAVIMSADMETDPYLIKDFIDYEKINPDAITTTSRWMKGGNFSGYSKPKLICNYIFQKIMQIMYLTRLTDLTCGYKCLPTDLLLKINWEEERHPIFLEMTLKPLRLGTEIKEIPMKWKPRTEGSSQNSFFQNFRYFKTAFKVRFMNKSKIVKNYGMR